MNITITVNEPFEYVKRNYETASWWSKHTVQPGTYEARKNGSVWWVTLDAVMTESFFVNRLFTASSVDHQTGLNKPAPISLSFYTFEIDRIPSWGYPITVNVTEPAL